MQNFTRRHTMLSLAGLAAGAAMTAALTAAPQTALAQDLKVGFVYVGPVSDHGWTFRHDQGRKAIEEKFGDRVSTTFVESVDEGADAERVITQLASTGHDLIFTTSFGYMNPTVKVASQFPDVKFEHATGYKRADNVSTYSGRFYEGRYVIGQIAAQMSETGVAGYVASFPIPEVVRGINSFLLGMRSVNPEATVKVVWVNSWYDPGKEADAAKALMDQGADIITQHTDSPAPLQTASERGILGFGQASDMIQFAPETQMTAIIDDWGPYYVARTQAVLDGTWASSDTWDGLAPGMAVMAPYTNIPDDVAAKAAQTVADIKSGALHPFQGPISDQAGNVVVEAGSFLDDGALLTMDYYVEGVDGVLPN